MCSEVGMLEEMLGWKKEALMNNNMPECDWASMEFYLMHITSPQVALVSIYEDERSLGWHGSYKKHVGMTMDQFYQKYFDGIKSLNPNGPAPAWLSIPRTKLKDTIDFRSITSGHLNK